MIEEYSRLRENAKNLTLTLFLLREYHGLDPAIMGERAHGSDRHSMILTRDDYREQIDALSKASSLHLVMAGANEKSAVLAIVALPPEGPFSTEEYEAQLAQDERLAEAVGVIETGWTFHAEGDGSYLQRAIAVPFKAPTDREGYLRTCRALLTLLKRPEPHDTTEKEAFVLDERGYLYPLNEATWDLAWKDAQQKSGEPDADIAERDHTRAWLARYGRTVEEVEAVAARWEAAGRDLELFTRLGRRRDRKAGAERLTWLVEGVLPRGTVSLLAGAQETGKSTLGTELAVSVARDDALRTWLGRNVDADGVAVLLTGEDPESLVNERLERLDPNDNAGKLVVYALNGRPLADICEDIARMPKVSLVVVDPARRYLAGDEDGSDNVNSFFSTLEELARRTGAAVLVIHHLVKNAQPRTLQDVRTLVRGSGVWLDRPRVVLGVYRRGDVTMVGIAKHNMPPSFPVMPETAFRRDAETLRHVPVGASVVAPSTLAPAEDSLERQVLAAVIRMAGEGIKIARTGSKELWALKPPEVEGIGRDRIRSVVGKLVEDGLLIDAKGGLHAAE